MKNLLRFLAFVLMVGGAYAQSNLPACIGKDTAKWSNCFGIEAYPSGTKYVGEFINGKPHGQGSFHASNGTISEGIWSDGKFVRSVPVQHTSIANPVGASTVTQPNVSFSNLPACLGRDSAKWSNCFGTEAYLFDTKYVGEFKDGKFHGQGAYHSSNGKISQGIWADGKLVSPAPLQQAIPSNQLVSVSSAKSNFSFKSSHILVESAPEAAYLYQEIQAAQGNKVNKFQELAIRFSKDPGSGKNSGQLGWAAKGTFVVEYEKVANELKVGEISMPFKTQFGWHLMYLEDKVELNQFSPTNAQEIPLASPQLSSSERDKLNAEVERKKRQELEQQLAVAKERDQITADFDLERKKRQELEAQLAASVLQPTPPQTNTPRRIAHALVIGNGAYPGSGRLDNPVNDANAISQKLRSMGFTVTTVTDANRQRLVQSMAQFRRTAASADISLLYYAGHGVQIFGTNYILPTDVDQTDPAQATIQGVSLNSVVENFLPGKTKLVFLDACRDNALQRTNDRSVSKGLAPISAAEGTLISYATKDGQTAADGVGSKNSPFTQALLEHLNDPQDIAVVLRKVRERVMKITGGKQQPWEYGSLTGGELVLSAIKHN